MSSGTAGNTPTGDRAVASSQTSLEAVAGCGRVTAGADSNRRTLVLYHWWLHCLVSKCRSRTCDSTINSRMLYPLS